MHIKHINCPSNNQKKLLDDINGHNKNSYNTLTETATAVQRSTKQIH